MREDGADEDGAISVEMPEASLLVSKLRGYGAGAVAWKFAGRGTDDHRYSVECSLPRKLSLAEGTELATWLVVDQHALAVAFGEADEQGKYLLTAIFMGNPPLEHGPRTKQTPDGLV